MALDAQRAAGLAKAKLQGLVRRAFPDITAEAEVFNAGAALAHGDQIFVYLIAASPSPLGAALAWGDRRGATQWDVIVDEPDPVLGAMVLGLHPRPKLWVAVGTDLVEMESLPLLTPGEPPAAAAALTPILARSGCDVVVEHGVITGEIGGLEVARIVIDADGSARVRVGVGLYDQEADAMMNPDTAVPDRLAQVVAQVRLHRGSEAAPHPLNRAARERWLRTVLMAEPSLLGLDDLCAVQPLVARGGIREATPVAAVGRDGSGSVLVVCSTGIDLNLVPTAAGHVGIEAPDRVVLVLPERDHHPVITQMAAHLRVPATLVHIPNPWP